MNTNDTLPAPTAVLRRREAPDLEWVTVESETIAWNAETAELHRLDPIATLIFQLCDGRTPLDHTIADLADAFGQPAEAVAPDVAECVARLRRDGLVEEVSR